MDKDLYGEEALLYMLLYYQQKIEEMSDQLKKLQERKREKKTVN